MAIAEAQVLCELRKRMLDPSGPAHSFEVILGCQPAVHSLMTRWVHHKPVSSRQMCHSATTMDAGLVDRVPSHFGHPFFLGGRVRDLWHPMGSG